jgi:hypothetical protein
MTNTPRRDIRVSLYDGAYGRTLRIDLQSLAHTKLLRAMFQSLHDGVRDSLKLLPDELWAFDGLSQLVLTTIPRGVAGAREVRSEGQGTSFVDWRMSLDGWGHCLDLLGPFLADRAPGHQYPTEERKGYLIVELAFLEPRPVRAEERD